MRISRILHNIDVGVEVQFALLTTNGVFVRLNTAVPEFTIVLGDRIFSNGGQRVFMYQPPCPERRDDTVLPTADLPLREKEENE